MGSRHGAPDQGRRARRSCRTSSARAQEVFVTGTAAEVTPVTQIGDYSFPVGPITKQLMADFDVMVRQPETVGAK